jgi:hypothetical protein
MTANYVLLEKITVGAAGAASVTFSGIPQTGYTDLVLRASSRSTRAGMLEDGFTIRLNSSTTGYTYKTLIGTGGGITNLNTTYEQTWAGEVNAATSTGSTFNNIEAYFPDYAGSYIKSYSVDSVAENNSGSGYNVINAITQSSTAAITSITCGSANGSLVAGSTFYLYGVAKLGTTPRIAPLATGGDIIETDGTYWYHAFLSSGTFTPSAIALSCDVLVVAGGGGGGRDSAGGGGAGGVFYATAQSVGTSAQTVTVGAGGAGATGYTTGTSGSNSQFGSLTVGVGGGAGATQNGLSGGSGGGAGRDTSLGGTGGSSTQTGTGGTGYGFAGGSAQSNGGGGGGGGAGAVGANGGAAVGGNGGIGLNTWSAWLSATGTGASGYIAGGGGGGANQVTPAGTGGSGGGGAGGAGSLNPGTAGTANTGGGGGGSSGGSGGVAGAAGGSGLVIVRYAV